MPPNCSRQHQTLPKLCFRPQREDRFCGLRFLGTKVCGSAFLAGWTSSRPQSSAAPEQFTPSTTNKLESNFPPFTHCSAAWENGRLQASHKRRWRHPQLDEAATQRRSSTKFLQRLQVFNQVRLLLCSQSQTETSVVVVDHVQQISKATVVEEAPSLMSPEAL